MGLKSDLATSIKKLFAEYENAFSSMASKAAEFYRSVGQTSAKILSMDETEISNEYSMVKIHWGVTFEKTGNKFIEFDVTYFVQKTAKFEDKIREKLF